MAVQYFAWDDAKNAKLRAERGIGFEDVVFHIEPGDLLDVLEHPNPSRYAGQRIFVVRRERPHNVRHQRVPRFSMVLRECALSCRRGSTISLGNSASAAV
jgi:hypothetical protein